MCWSSSFACKCWASYLLPRMQWGCKESQWSYSTHQEYMEHWLWQYVGYYVNGTRCGGRSYFGGLRNPNRLQFSTESGCLDCQCQCI